MAIKILDAGGVLRTLTSIKVQDGGSLRTIQRVKVLDGATLRTVAEFVAPMSVSAAPETANGFSLTSTVTTETVTATPTGGQAPYTYAWTITSGSATINSPALASTTFTKTDVPLDFIGEASAQVTVTDAIGQTAFDTVQLTFFRSSLA